jgi:hypothetical protein
VEHWYTSLISGYDQRLQMIQGTWNRLRFMIWGHLYVFHEEPEMAKLIISEIRPGPEYRDTAVFSLNRDYTRRTLAIIDEAVASGEFRPDVPREIVRAMIYGGVEHHAFGFLRGEGDFSPDDAADAITDLVYRGLASGSRAQALMLSGPIRQIETGLERLKQIVAAPKPEAAQSEKRTAGSRKKQAADGAASRSGDVARKRS